MSFLATEISTFLGSPSELYEFTADGTTRRYTSASKSQLTLGGVVWAPRALRRSNIEQAKEFSRSAITVSAPRDFPVALDFIASPPEGPLTLTIYRRHSGDPDSELAVYWQGRVVGVLFSNSGATLKCDTAYTGIQAIGRRATYAIPCRHTLYESGSSACNVNREAFKVVGALTAVNELHLSAVEFGTKPNGWFLGGQIELSVDGVTKRRLIVGHDGSSIWVMSGVAGLAVGDTFEAFAGCDLSLGTCDSKFANSINHGGFPWKPLRNPFTGDSIY